MATFKKDLQYYKFCLYGFLKNLRFFEPFLYLFFLEQGLTFFQIGTLVTIREITRNIFEIPTGILADTFGRRRTMIFSFISYLVSFAIFFFFNKYMIFVLAMVLFSFGDAFRSGTHKAMIFEYLSLKGWEDLKVYYYGHTRSWSQMGSAVSSLLAAILVFYSGAYRYIFAFTMVPYLLDLVLMLTYPKELEGKRRNLKFNEIGHSFKEVVYEIHKTFKMKKVFRILSNISIFSGYFRSIKDYLQPLIIGLALFLPTRELVESKQGGTFFIGLVYFFIFIFTSFSSRFSGRMNDRTDRPEKILNMSLVIGLFAGLLAGLFYFKTIFLTGLLSVIFFIGIFLVENFRKPIGVAVISDFTKKELLATVLFVESQIKGIFTALLAPIVGVIADRLGVGFALSLMSVFLLIAFPLVRLKKI